MFLALICFLKKTKTGIEDLDLIQTQQLIYSTQAEIDRQTHFSQ
jgi:hypothetical protein